VHQRLSVGLREPGGNPSFEERVPLSSVHEFSCSSVDESVKELLFLLMGGMKAGRESALGREKRKPVCGDREPFG